MKVSYCDFHPFIRKVGVASNICQCAPKIALDYRAICVLEGFGNVEYNGKNYSTEPFDVLLIKPGRPYRVTSNENQVLTVVNFDCTYAQSQIDKPVPSVYVSAYQEDRIIDNADISHLFEDDSDLLIRFKGNGEVNQLFLRMHQIYMSAQTTRKVKNLLLSSLLEQVVAMMLGTSATESQNSRNVADEIFLYIHCHYAETITLRDLSKVFHFHGNYINRLLRSRYNVSFHKMLMTVRLEQAVLLLENTDRTLSEIAEQTGFGSLRQFTDCFKKSYGMTPSVYRKRKEVSFSLI